MTRKEFAVLAMALQASYPRHNLLPNDEAMELWYQQFKDSSFEVLSTAVYKWINTEKWPPSISELRTACAEIKHGALPDWGEGWYEVTRAVRRYGYMRETEALESMSEITRAAVRRIGWKDICASENPEAIRAQFRQVYEISVRREVEERQMPQALKDAVQGLIGSGVAQIGGRR